MLLRTFIMAVLLSLCHSCEEQPTAIKSSAYVKPCPESYSLVSKSYLYGTDPFCVSQDLMAIDSESQLIVRSNNAMAAILGPAEAEDQCQSLGSNYDLISLAEYQVTAREVELLDENWSGGKVGAGSLGKDKKFSRLLSGDTVDGNGNVNRGGGQDASATWTKEELNSFATAGLNLDLKAAEFYLSLPPVILSNAPFDDLSKWFAPLGDYSLLKDVSTGHAGMGLIKFNTGSGTIIRGPFTGATFQAEFKQSATGSVGFHCVYHP